MMTLRHSDSRRSRILRSRRAALPRCESLEDRTVASGSTVSVGISAAALNPSPIYHHVHRGEVVGPVLGRISGRVVNDTTGKGIGKIAVQLIDSNGDVVQTIRTGCKGHYAFKIRENGPYVVREVTPRQFTQTSPTFAYTEPEGSMAAGTGSASWSYNTGNSNPANGPVGVYAWDTVAPAGDLPFESPINITAPPIDLSPYLSINYQNAVPTQIVNNSHQIQVQYPGSNSDTINIGGVPFELAQFHFHDPSENTVNNHGYSMELHFVNTSADGAETVVAVFLQLGAHNSALDPILNAATSSLTQPNTKTTISSAINFAGLLPSNLNGWFYEGSLTTPPLSQPVNWFVLATPITLDFQQLQQYEAVAGGSDFLPNNRPIQPLDGRQVNQFAFDVNFQDQSVFGLTFSNSKKRSG